MLALGQLRPTWQKPHAHARPLRTVTLLRARRERPRYRRAAKKHDELAPPHVAYSTPRIMDFH